MNKIARFLLVFNFLFFSCESQKDKSFIGVSYIQDLSIEKGFDGRLLLMFSKKLKPEPRFQINDSKNTGIVVGIDVEDWKPREVIKFNPNLLAYPINQLKDIPDGEYYVQALLHKYDTFKMATGFELKLPMDQGEGQKWNISPKNLYSEPVKIKIQKKTSSVEIVLNKEIPEIEPIKDSKYIKHVKIQSELLTKFWGRPMFLQANVLLPKDFKKTGIKRYPLMIFHGHFPNTFRGFRNKPPDASKTDSIFNERFGITGYKFIQEKEAHNFHNKWLSKSFPRFMVIEIQHQNPYYDDSYAVNSANLGPYGDAITYELIPHVEKLFDGIGEGWGRFLYGGSTGGWEALAAQVFYPKEYNGCFAACPDPIDFRAFTIVDIYNDKNAYFDEGEFTRNLRPGIRDGIGRIKAYLKDINRREYILGTNSRSGDQWDIWQAVYSPVGEIGYPKPIWDKLTGEIDEDVANYWKENYDLRYIMERDWSKIGKDLKGKINIYCGDMDNYYLNNAVVLTEKFLKETKNPYYEGEVEYGNGAEHCWNGDQRNPNHISRLRYNTMYINKIKKQLKLTAPRNNNLINWD